MASTESNKTLARRRFLANAMAGTIGIGAGVLLIRFATGKDAGAPASDAQRWGLLIDSNQCASGCTACVTACNEEHGLDVRHGPETDAQWIRKVTLRDRHTGRVSTLPVMCQHCDEPPCVDVCPTGASFKRADGIVLVDKHTCIGCRYCIVACPFKARSFIHEELDNQKPHAPRGKGTVEACTLCVHRVDAEEQRDPACAEACARAGHAAMVFGDLKDPESQISKQLDRVQSRQLRADLQLNTGVRYQGI